MAIKTLADQRAEHQDRMSKGLVDMARALLRCRGESDWTIRNITHAVEQCAETVGSGYFDTPMAKDRAIDDAIYAIVEAP